MLDRQRRWNDGSIGYVVAIAVVGTVVTLAGQVGAATAPRGRVRAGDQSSATPSRSRSAFSGLPVSFEPNVGQADPRARFLARSADSTLLLTDSGVVLAMHPHRASGSRTAQASTVRMRVVGATRPNIVAHDALPGTVNYFLGSEPTGWHTGIPTYGRVDYEDVVPGVTLAFYGSRRQLEYDLVVRPGTDPRSITLAFDGADSLSVDSAGELTLRTKEGDIRQRAAHVYQDIDGIRRDVAARFVRKGARRVGFAVAAYDRHRPLIIDPEVTYVSYFGGSGNDAVADVVVDATGAAYVTGTTGSADLPTTSGAYDQGYAGGTCGIGFTFPCGDVFVAKFNPAGDALVYSTYIGGGADDRGLKLAVDAAGNAYVTGETGAGFPTTPGVVQTSTGFTFVTKLNPSGTGLVYSTYVGGTSTDGGDGIAVDGSGAAYVGGGARDAFLPTTGGAYQPGFGGGPSPFASDGFVLKLNPSGTAYDYVTYLGGNNIDLLFDLVLIGGDAVVTGATYSPNFPTTAGAYQTSLGGGSCTFGSLSVPCSDVFVTRLNASGSGLVFSTLIGGNGEERALGIAADGSGSVYVTGALFSGSPNYPTTPGAYITGGSFGFITKLNATGSALVYSTDFDEYGSAIAVDGAGTAYVAGSKQGPFSSLPRLAYQPVYGGGFDDAYVVRLNSTGSALLWGSYLGGSDDDGAAAVAVSATGAVYVVGSMASSDVQTTPGAVQGLYGGGDSDGFVARLVPFCPDSPYTGCRQTGSGKSSIKISDKDPSIADKTERFKWKWAHGALTDKADFGDPLGTTRYAVCVYDESGNVPTLVYGASVQPGGICKNKPCWTDTGTGFKYKNATFSTEGITKLLLKSGADGKAKITVKGKGIPLALPPLPFTQDTKVTVQFTNSVGQCWDAEFSTNSENTSNAFNARSD